MLCLCLFLRRLVCVALIPLSHDARSLIRILSSMEIYEEKKTEKKRKNPTTAMKIEGVQIPM